MKKIRQSFETVQKIKRFIESEGLIDAGSHILVGLSGGADSVCLLVILHSLREELGFTMSAVHIHHGIREITADNDAKFVKNLCEELDIPIKIVRRNIPQEARETGESIEECARKIRYEEFAKEALQYEKSLIAVAHHKDDQAETVLFRIMRGTGIKGLKAMRPKNDNIIRPLLCVNRREIIDFLDREKYSYCTDETNEDVEYSRNRIRHLILPEAEKICSEAADHIAEIANEAARTDAFLEKMAHELYEKALVSDEPQQKAMDAFVLSAEDEILSQRAVKEMIGNMIHSLKDITREHVSSILNLLPQEKSASVNLPKNLLVRKEGGKLIFTIEDSEKKKNLNKEVCIKVPVPGKLLLPDGRMMENTLIEGISSSDISRNVYTKCLDYDKINPDLCIRTRQEGDFLITDSKGSHKSISRYMIDEKIPKSQRDEVYLLASGSEIYWVIGYRISESVKITETTNTILRIQVKETDNE